MIVTITGKTCSGKTTLEQALMALGMARVISHTTRAPRPHEINGQHYHFMEPVEFESFAARGGLIERNEFGGNHYGKSYGSLIQALGQRQHVVMVVEPNGVNAIARHARLTGQSHMAVWLEVSPRVQAQRFLERLSGQGADAERLAAMISTEQGWRTAAGYHLILESDRHAPEYIAATVGHAMGAFDQSLV